MQVVRAVRGMGQYLSVHCFMLCKVKLVSAQIKKREVWTGLGGLEVRSEGIAVQRRMTGVLGIRK